MAAELVGQFHARDAEGRVYLVHEFQESDPSQDGSGKDVITYKLAIGDRVNKLDEGTFVRVQFGVELIREPETPPQPQVLTETQIAS